MSGARQVGDRWVFDVRDATGENRTFAFAIRDGQVICSGPRWWAADIATMISLASALTNAISEAGRS